MRCDDVRRALVEREIGLLSDSRAAVLDRHLDRCPACRALEAAERRLTADLALLGSAAVPRVEVRDRVFRAIGGMESVDRSPVPPRDLAWAGVGAAALAVAVLAAGLPLLPSVPDTAGQVWALFTGLWVGAASVLRPLASLITVLEPFRDMILDTLRLLAPFGGLLGPAVVAATALSLALMTGVTTLVVGRDFVRGRRAHRRGALT
jgi:anti-sigma factor RsiW